MSTFVYSLFKLRHSSCHCFFFFFNDTATTEIYTLSLHDALPISISSIAPHGAGGPRCCRQRPSRSEEHTSELQSRRDLVCRLLLEKKNVEAIVSGLAPGCLAGTWIVGKCSRG